MKDVDFIFDFLVVNNQQNQPVKKQANFDAIRYITVTILKYESYTW